MAVRLNPKTGQLESYNPKTEVMKPFAGTGGGGTSTPTKDSDSTADAGKPLIFTDEKTGRPSGMVTVDGKTYFGMSPDEVKSYTESVLPAAQTVGEFAQGNVNAPGLAEKQQKELEAIDALKGNEKPLTTAQRNAAAGKAVQESMAANLGISPELASAVTPLANLPITQQAIGIIATTGIAGVSLSTLFSPASGNIKQLQGDISNNVAESTRIARAATSKGANVKQAIKSLVALEESTRFKYNAAKQSLRESPKDVREGLDLQDEMSRNLRVMVENRQALERYAVTGDPKEVLLDLGTEEFQ
jgi:hypothetical protein